MRNIRDRQARLNDIISIILDHISAIQYKELKKETGLSDPVLSKYLKHLVDSKIILAETSGREKYYTISKDEFEKSDYKILETIQNYWTLFSIQSDIQNKSMKGINDMVDEIEKSVTGMIFYLTIKSLDDGKNWMYNIKPNDIAIRLIISFLHYFTGIGQYTKLGNILESPNSDVIFEEFKKTEFTQNEMKLWQKLKGELLRRYEKQIKQFEDTTFHRRLIDELLEYNKD